MSYTTSIGIKQRGLHENVSVQRFEKVSYKDFIGWYLKRALRHALGLVMGQSFIYKKEDRAHTRTRDWR